MNTGFDDNNNKQLSKISFYIDIIQKVEQLKIYLNLASAANF